MQTDKEDTVTAITVNKGKGNRGTSAQKWTGREISRDQEGIVTMMKRAEIRFAETIEEMLTRIAEMLTRIAEMVEEILTRIAEILTRIAEILTRIAEILTRIAEILTRIAEILTRIAEMIKEILTRIAEMIEEILTRIGNENTGIPMVMRITDILNTAGIVLRRRVGELGNIVGIQTQRGTKEDQEQVENRGSVGLEAHG